MKATPTKETVRSQIAELANAAGCGEKKSITSEDFLSILVLVLIRNSFIAAEDFAAAYSALKHCDANASAMRQRLYESKAADDKVIATAERWQALAAPAKVDPAKPTPPAKP
jgi:hypothetical protein